MNGSGRPVGRPAAIQWPIRRTVMISGAPRPMLIEENTTAKCVRCGAEFLINSDTAFVMKTELDSFEVVRCPRCNRIADAFYYLREPPRPPRIKTPELTMIPWKTPEDW